MNSAPVATIHDHCACHGCTSHRSQLRMALLSIIFVPFVSAVMVVFAAIFIILWPFAAVYVYRTFNHKNW